MFSLASEQTNNLIVFDLEWNQSSYNPNHRMPHEIIEIGACRVNRDYEVVDTFSRTICPRLYKKLDKHIKSVTGITEAELAEGGAFADVFGEFIAWCGEDALLVTWGRDDFPVLRRNAQFFQTPMPFSPPVDAQLVFGHACLKSIHQQMNLHNALETMHIEVDVPAHRAVYDAQCTAALLCKIDEAARELDENAHKLLVTTISREQRIAASSLRSVPTRHIYQSEALQDTRLMTVECPACGRRTAFDTPWFDAGREKYLALAHCPQHGMAYCQMHFKRVQSGTLVMHQRAYPADAEQITDTREKYRLYLLTPPKKRHHRLSMDGSAKPAQNEKHNS